MPAILERMEELNYTSLVEEIATADGPAYVLSEQKNYSYIPAYLGNLGKSEQAERLLLAKASCPVVFFS